MVYFYTLDAVYTYNTLRRSSKHIYLYVYVILLILILILIFLSARTGFKPVLTSVHLSLRLYPVSRVQYGVVCFPVER